MFAEQTRKPCNVVIIDNASQRNYRIATRGLIRTITIQTSKLFRKRKLLFEYLFIQGQDTEHMSSSAKQESVIPITAFKLSIHERLREESCVPSYQYMHFKASL